MLPALHARMHRPSWADLALALARLAGDAGVASAFQVSLMAPHARGEWAVVDARLDDLFEDRVVQSLERGMPATIQVHAELWRRRGLWFDALVNTFDASVRVRYGTWDESYHVERQGGPPLRFATLDSAETYLERPWALPVGRLAALSAGARHYVVVTVTLKPLTAEDVREVEGWMSGEPVGDHGGDVTDLPRGVFDALRNVSGFGDRRARAVSEDFVPERLAQGSRTTATPAPEEPRSRAR
ncbi:MAG TPA: DUF4390 domain-containing protein [Dongiaceae bacterium]|nr:DUF4390 domain-containing protein [Dongiaceae bacterium]